MTKNELLKKVLQLRSEKKLEESNSLMKNLAEQFPQDAYIQYQCAWSYDVLGEEAKAVPHYEAALKGNLEPDDLKSAYLGLGSTYRALGDYQNSKRVFEEGMKRFPKQQALKTFYALTLYNLGEAHDAVQLLLKTLVATTADSEILSYEKALAFYADHLDETWT